MLSLSVFVFVVLSQSVPKGRSPPLILAIKNFASSLTSRKSILGHPTVGHHPPIQNTNSLESDCVSEAKTATTSSSETVLRMWLTKTLIRIQLIVCCVKSI